jgi:tRNA 5-methylaminomethyl-2-thiouridine biosynthesis bifunctional protein
MPGEFGPGRLVFDADGTPRSPDYDDVYHSADGGPAQARHVFLGGSDLPQRWRGGQRFVVLETGFGLGLNFLCTWQAWRGDAQAPARLDFVSVEKHPLPRGQLAAAHARWPELAALAAALQAGWPPPVPGFHRLHFEGGRLTLTLLFGDVEDVLARLSAAADAVYLDGYAPDRNPRMWSPALMRRLARLAAPGATLATWTVAGAVRQALAEAGFLVAKRPGYGRKREMLAAMLPATQTCRAHRPSPAPAGHAIVIGAGIAGTAVAERLAARGWRIDLIERNAEPAREASGNHAGVLLPLVSLDDNVASRLSRACYLYALRLLRALDGAQPAPAWSACGVMQVARDARHEALQREAAARLPAEFVEYVGAQEAARRTGVPVAAGGWFFPGGAWINPPSLCAALLACHAERIDPHYGRGVARLARRGESSQAFDAEDQPIAEAPVVVLANAWEAQRLAALLLPLRRVRGQVSHLPGERLGGLASVVCREGYVAPAWQGVCALGASFDVGDEEPQPTLAGHAGNLARLERLLPGAAAGIDPAKLAGRVGFRTATPDRLPLVGALPAPAAAARPLQLAHVIREPGLVAALGYGARGLVWAPLAAELVASQLCGEPLPLPADLVDAVDPARFLVRAARRAR